MTTSPWRIEAPENLEVALQLSLYAANEHERINHWIDRELRCSVYTGDGLPPADPHLTVIPCPSCRYTTRYLGCDPCLRCEGTGIIHRWHSMLPRSAIVEVCRELEEVNTFLVA